MLRTIRKQQIDNLIIVIVAGRILYRMEKAVGCIIGFFSIRFIIPPRTYAYDPSYIL